MNFIGEYQISEEAVDELIDYWNTNKANAEDGTVGNNRVDKKFKKSLEVMITPKDLTNFLRDIRKWIFVFFYWVSVTAADAFGLKRRLLGASDTTGEPGRDRGSPSGRKPRNPTSCRGIACEGNEVCMKNKRGFAVCRVPTNN